MQHLMFKPDILISECGPRDGLQMVKRVMSTTHKLRWIEALHAAGVREIEVCSFVPARLMPQMADAAQVVRHAVTLPGLTVLALVPNLQGAQAALAAGAHKLTIPVSGSEAHSLANVRLSRAAMVQEVRRIVAWRNDHARHVPVEANISVAFGCTLEGHVPEDDVVRLCGELVAAGVDDSGLSDTTGMANPVQVRRLFTRVIAEIGDQCGAAHMHNTRGLGLANNLAAYEAGVRIFDASLCGLGGCPHAPGASGNVATEDLVFMFEAMGIATGIDLPRLIAARECVIEGLPGEPLYGLLAQAGLPKDFVSETQRRLDVEAGR
jgi:hydroxymethylglutaryl-CoA lyase